MTQPPDNRVTCSKCLELPEPAAVFARVELVTEAHRIRHWEGVIDTTPTIHHLDAGATVVQYALREYVRCSFPDRTDHMNGIIARPRCAEYLLRVGHICAEHHTVGIELARQHVKRSRQHFKRISELQVWPAECLALLLNARETIDRWKLFWPVDQRWRHALTRLANGPASDHEYTVRGRESVRKSRNDFEMIQRDTEFVNSVHGLEFFRRPFSSSEYEQLVADVRALCRIDKASLSDPTVVDGLYPRVRGARKRTDAFMRWVEYGVQFLVPANLAAAKALAMKHFR